MQGRDAQPPDRDLSVPGRRHRLRRRDPRRGRHRPRRQAQGGPRRLHRVQPATPRRGVQPWEDASYGKPEPHRLRRCDIMIEGPLGGAAFNNEFGRPAIDGLLPHLRAGGPQRRGTELRGYHKPIMLAGGLGNIQADTRREGRHRRPATSSSCSAGPAMLIGLGGGAASFDGQRHQQRGPRFRSASSAATPRWSAAARRSSTAAGRWATSNPILVRSTTSARAASRTPSPNSSTTAAAAADSNSAQCPTTSPA